MRSAEHCCCSSGHKRLSLQQPPLRGSVNATLDVAGGWKGLAMAPLKQCTRVELALHQGTVLLQGYVYRMIPVALAPHFLISLTPFNIPTTLSMIPKGVNWKGEGGVGRLRGGSRQYAGRQRTAPRYLMSPPPLTYPGLVARIARVKEGSVSLYPLTL